MSVRRTFPVLVVGAGLVGLSTAIALRRQGVDALVIERHPGTSTQPKARRFNFRTMEVFRSLGVAGAVTTAAAGLASYEGMRMGRTLVESQPLPAPAGVDFGQLGQVSPEQSCLVAQDLLEPVLLDLARQAGAEVRFATELVALAQEPDGVTATLRDVAGEHTARAGYLVGADGSRSTVRELLGIGRTGAGSLSRSITVYFDADLSELVRGREFNLCQIEHERAPGAFASVDGARRWLFYSGEMFGAGEARDDAEHWAAIVRTAIGVSDVEVTVRSVQAWEPAMLVAERFVAGRVLLAGDAAHVMPPYAALGANTGVQDAANLAWKLATALPGQAGTDLVESYHTERYAAGWYAADQSARRTGGLRDMLGERPAELAHPFALVAGFQYPAGALVPEPDDPAPMDRLELTGRPGTRVPHAWLAAGVSTLDVARPGWALLTGPSGSDWLPAARSLGLAAAQVPDYCVDKGALLVRPDNIVAWRTASAAPGTDPLPTLHAILTQCVCT
jgi:2-polyprenyl-6-methoxyphenol hydroxylase-like FAD-dependent oxidoreductase